jgi:hypothetical protein
MVIEKLSSKLEPACKKIIFYLPRKFSTRKDFREMLEFYSQFIRKGDLCFDVGANTKKKRVNYLCQLGYMQFYFSLGESKKFLFQKWIAPDELCKKIVDLVDPLFRGDTYARFL